MLNLELHHIGVAARDIRKEMQQFMLLGYKQASDFFIDARQQIRGVMLEAPFQPRLELLENLGTTGPLDSALARGIKLYHLAYQVADLNADLPTYICQTGGTIIVPPCDAEFFKKICFVILPNLLLTELVEVSEKKLRKET